MREIAGSASTFPFPSSKQDRTRPHLPKHQHLLLDGIRHPPRRLILLLDSPALPLPIRHLLVLLDDIAARAAARLEDIRAAVALEVVLVADIGALHGGGDGRQAQHAGAAEEKALSMHIHQHVNTPGVSKKHTDPLQHEYPPRSPLLRTRWRVLPYVAHGTQQPTRHVLKGEKHPNSEVTHGWAGADPGALEWRCSLGADMMMIGGTLERLWGGNSRSRS